MPFALSGTYGDTLIFRKRHTYLQSVSATRSIVLVLPMEFQNVHLTTHRSSRREVYGTHLMLQVRCP